MQSVAIASLVALIWLDYHYLAIRPDKPDPALGMVYELNNHGSIVFLTKAEHFLMDWLFFGGLFGCTILTGMIYGAERRMRKATGIGQDRVSR